MKSLAFFLVALFIQTTFAVSAPGPIIVPESGPPLRVACVGDSITFGYGMKPAQSYPSQLQILLGSRWEVRNFGVSARTLLRKGDHPYWQEKAFQEAQDFQPNVVIIMLGTNDTKPLNWKFKDEFVADYRDLVKIFQALPSKPHIFLCRPCPVPEPGNFGINETNIQSEIPWIDQIAKELGAGIIDMHAALAPRPELLTDRVHPNAVGALIMAETAASALTGQAVAINPVNLEPYILTPPAPPTPRINGAGVVGVRPGSPFLFLIPATGDRPMTFSATGLPEGLKLDPKSGQITGTIAQAGTSVVTLSAKNALGTADKKLRIVCGDRIALTPPMGWNSWNCFAGAVSADKVERAANAMVSSGLINHGWNYINVDDFWQNSRDSKDPTLQGDFRDAQGNIVTNKRFPDMKALADYIHNLGLKAGLYSSPGPWTCGGCAGSFGYEKQDAEIYAKWGFDYLKYDWCSYIQTDPKRLWPNGEQRTSYTPAQLTEPYTLMGKLLAAQKRDIVFSLCQYGMGDVWKWGDSVGGQCWRTTDDIRDTWESMSEIALAQDAAAALARPGNWNDPDMLILGTVGWGKPHPSRLTPDEQYLHFSLWSLFSAPLLIGCDMEKLDAFTLNLLTNDEVIAINQDPLGKQAICVNTVGKVRIYVKELEDGSRAVGFCNFGLRPAKLAYQDFAKLGIIGRQKFRDLWRQKDLGTLDTASENVPLTIPAHGVVLYKFTPAS